MRTLLIAGSTPIIGFNFWLAGGQMVNLVRAVLDGTPTGWIVVKAILAATMAVVFLVRLMIALERTSAAR